MLFEFKDMNKGTNNDKCKIGDSNSDHLSSHNTYDKRIIFYSCYFINELGADFIR